MHKLDEKALAAALDVADFSYLNNPEEGGAFDTAIQAAIAAYLAAAPSPAAVAVKVLEWNRTNSDRSIHIATALPGEYWAWELAGFGYWSWGSLSGREVFGGIEGAKAAAQADYESRIRSALVEPGADEAGGQT